jgi:SAM-dependent methyltransferase
VADPYTDGTCTWWTLSAPPPELEDAIADGWLGLGGRALDVGCGLGYEAGHLATVGWAAVGVDVSAEALEQARARHPAVRFLRADVRRLPFTDGVFDVVTDRGCFHYLAVADRGAYADEVRRVLRPGGRLLLRASLRAAGVRNDIDAAVVRRTFDAFTIDELRPATVPSDTRELEVLLARLTRK